MESDYGMGKSYCAFPFIEPLSRFLESAVLPLTCFVEGQIFEKEPGAVERFQKLGAEFELHSHTHAQRGKADVAWEIESARRAYVKFFHQEPLGYRFPRGNLKDGDYELLWREGFKFSSSIFPSFRPGEYNNLRKPVMPFFPEDYPLPELPISVVSSRVRIPISLSYLMLLGRLYISYLKRRSLPPLLLFEFHLHDLGLTQSYFDLPLPYRILHGRNRTSGFDILCDFLLSLKEKGYHFIKVADLYQDIARLHNLERGAQNGA